MLEDYRVKNYYVFTFILQGIINCSSLVFRNLAIIMYYTKFIYVLDIKKKNKNNQMI